MHAFNNQYLLTSHDIPRGLPESFATHGPIAGYTLHASVNLPVTTVRNKSTEETVTILGDIFDPHQPEATNDDIAAQMTTRSPNQTVFEALQTYSGRYVALITGGDRTIIVPDAACLRRVLYTEDATTITSSPMLFLKLFGLDHSPDPEVARFIDSTGYGDNREVEWAGTKTVDSRLTSLLPNHYLDTDKGGPHRRPLFAPNISSTQDARETIMTALNGCLDAIAQRYSGFRFPITAGWDSRLLLAAAAGVEDQASFCTFATTIGLDHPDVRIAVKLAEQLDIDHAVITPRELTEEFVMAMQEMHIVPRLTGRARTIQYDWYHADRQEAMITGNTAEIMRTFYDIPHTNANPSLLANLYGYPDSAFVHSELAEWLPAAEEYAEHTGIDIFDLFYWEQRMGNWGARAPYERDIALTEISPFNNYDLLLSGLSVPRNKRKAPDYTFFDDLLTETRPEVLEYSINPNPAKAPMEKVKEQLKYAAKEHRTVHKLANTYRRVL